MRHPIKQTLTSDSAVICAKYSMRIDTALLATYQTLTEGKRIIMQR